MRTFANCLLALVLLIFACYGQEANRDVKQQPELATIVRNWAEKLGGELWHFGELVTRRNMVIDSYKRTTVVPEDGDSLLKDMAEKIKKMMDEKVTAVRRIMEVAENKAVMQGDDVEPSFEFYNAKNLINSAPNETFEEHEEAELNESEQAQKLHQDLEPYQNLVQTETGYGYQQDQDLPDAVDDVPKVTDIETVESEQDAQASQTPPDDKRRLPLFPNPQFYNIPVNTNHSAVHVPSNVYERSKEVIKGIKWSEELDNTFKNNYKEDPTLSWQYFGSSTGFMRQFPAMIWSQEPVDLFDCRTRSWYIEAASSPKDIIILVDRSGSMTGMRREVARHVVNNILDTLGNNDFVNIFTFSNTTDTLIDCFNDILVQANLANVRALKEEMANFRTEQIANFSLALTTAFRLLQNYRENKLGAQCNQAIMLVTDGVQYNYKEIFKEYNWQNLPFMPVRVFTYLIGREVSDVREVKWMACANQGYYVHLSTYAEVREQVLQYIPVMARPMVLNPSVKPHPTWSPVYADVADPKLTNWLWVTRERNKQRERFILYRRNKTMFIPDEQDRKYVHRQKHKPEEYGDLQVYRLMTSVSLPVYDKRPNANITEQIQINEATWITVTRETRVANLLGVAGTDVPIEYIQRLMMPYRIGVNGYAFIVTNNGYILIHPDLRPVFQGILKPAYNRVDLLEVEVMDDDSEPRDFNESIIELRRNVVMQSRGHVMLKVKTHLDDLRRIILSNRHYHYMGINNTPFSVVLALPDRYGFNRIQYALDDDIHRMRSNNMIKGPVTQFFTGNWTIHPDWLYCKYSDDKHNFETPEEELLHFLVKIDLPRWKWSRECDSKLIKSLVADAKMTEWFNQNITTSNKDENGHEFIKRFGITVAFLSTYSGLTRWQDFPQNIGDKEARDEPHFHQLHNKAIDEVWYRRAVEQHYVEPRSFVYSVPFDVGDENNTLVTASHAIFKDDGTRKAPAAVVGFQFYHSALRSLFTKITSTCGNIQCKRTCSSQELYCLVLDDNGYVIVSDEPGDTGRFLGDLRSDIMSYLIDEGVYKATRMFDYQATCFRSTDTGSHASRSLTSLLNVSELLRWAITTLVYLTRSVWCTELLPTNEPEHEDEDQTILDEPPLSANEKEFDPRVLIRKTSPEPCDQDVSLYTLGLKNTTAEAFDRTMTIGCDRPFIVQPVIGSNMILLVINNVCYPEDRSIPSPELNEIDYNISLTCYRVVHDAYPRRHYMSCINRSIHEREIELCGTGSSLRTPIVMVLLAIAYLAGRIS
ncbi:voltage-dependent calcium channel subunit alpha-2/delta-3 isoform X2 [Photinus pyralis]|uniref:voltage-dependent calcium channel subunit alpha-2/delta-3 isoform X2 n=1 Tax=Photinus pyralis TaxID=7054 RepID=UPI0012677E22|nr:voltage-dependent calcium channel subunit alpha-2/delta-3 isoform X2 [Photinus pyralis]